MVFWWVVNKLKGWIMGAAAIAAFVAYIYKQGRDDGADKVRERLRKEQDAAIKKKRDLEDDVANDSDSELDKRLSRWIKDNDS